MDQPERVIRVIIASIEQNESFQKPFFPMTHFPQATPRSSRKKRDAITSCSWAPQTRPWVCPYQSPERAIWFRDLQSRSALGSVCHISNTSILRFSKKLRTYHMKMNLLCKAQVVSFFLFLWEIDKWDWRDQQADAQHGRCSARHWNLQHRLLRRFSSRRAIFSRLLSVKLISCNRGGGEGVRRMASKVRILLLDYIWSPYATLGSRFLGDLEVYIPEAQSNTHPGYPRVLRRDIWGWRAVISWSDNRVSLNHRYIHTQISVWCAAQRDCDLKKKKKSKGTYSVPATQGLNVEECKDLVAFEDFEGWDVT